MEYQANYGNGWEAISLEAMRAELECSDAHFAKVLTCLHAGGMAYGKGFYQVA